MIPSATTVANLLFQTDTTEGNFTWNTFNGTNGTDYYGYNGTDYYNGSGPYLYDYGYYPDYPCPTTEDEAKWMNDIPCYHLCIHTLLPIICSVGVVGILLTVIVLSRKNMCTSTNCYLTSLAIADLCFLLLLSCKLLETRLSLEGHYKYILFMTYAHIFMNTFLFASVWLTVMLAIERYIAICIPLQAMNICTVLRARFVIVAIFVFSAACRIPQFLEFKIYTYKDQCLDNKEVQSIKPTELGQNLLYLRIYAAVVDCALCVFLPCAALLFLNGFLIYEIHRSTKYLRYHLALDSDVRTIISSEEVKITIMLISVIIVFFICQGPFLAMQAIKVYYMFHESILTPEYHLFNNIIYLLLALRSSFNFILYCWFSEKFWNTFKRVFCMPGCMSRFLRWPSKRIVSGNSEHVTSNNNRKVSYFNTKETVC